MKAFVTGATGMLGNNLIRLLLKKGYSIKALVRSSDKAQKVLSGLNIEFVEGDMQNVAGFAEHLAATDVVFHTAAYFREAYSKGKHWSKLKAINIDGTQALLEAAEAHKVKKFIHVSSGGIIGKSEFGLSDETNLAASESLENLYFRSKLECDQMIAEFLNTHSLAVTTILPGWMFGPFDAAPTQAGKIVLDFLNKKLPASFQGGANVSDARDVANAMFEAVGLGVSGERYLVAGPFVSLPDLLKSLETVTSVKAPRMVLPKRLALGAAWFSERLNPKGNLSVSGVKTMSESQKLSSAKAEKVLHANFRPLETTLKDTIDWFKANGYV